MSRPDWRWRVVNVGVFAGFAFYCLYYLTAFRFGNLFTDAARMVDFIQWHYFPPLILQHLEYPSVAFDQWTLPFPYLPSAIAMFMPLSLLPRPLAFGLWLTLQAASLIAILWAAIKLSHAEQSPARYLIAFGAVLLADNPISWDFRNHNNNVIYLALIMLALVTKRVWLGGLLLAISANLKVYSGPLVAGFLWRREYRLVLAMTVAGVALAVILPILVFGWSGYIHLMAGWFGQVDFNPPPGRAAVLPANLFRAAAAALSGVEVNSAAAGFTLHAAQAVWVVVVCGYFVIATRARPADADSRARLADVIVILLAPLPFSSYFAPYHAVPLLPAYVLLLSAAVDVAAPRWLRFGTGSAIVLAQLAYYSNREWQFRGATYLACFMIVTLGLGALRWASAQRDFGH